MPSFQNNDFNIPWLIEIFEKYRLLLIGGLIAGILLSFVWWSIDKHLSYTGNVVLKIGKIANTSIEDSGDLFAYLKSELFINKDEALKKIRVEINRKEYRKYPDVHIFNLSLQSNDKHVAMAGIQKAVDEIIERHSVMYENANKELRAFSNSKEYDVNSKLDLKTKLFLTLESYNYPTSVIKSVRVIEHSSLAMTFTIFPSFFLLFTMLLIIALEYKKRYVCRN